MRVWLSLILGILLLPGCMVIRVTARNPIPQMTTIAIAPFFNLTQEPNSVVDGRRFALAYYSELQKTQGFEVIPVGVVEATILQHRLELQNPEDALKLCELVKADAIVIGAVTDYDAYYPPRIALQVDWYSPYEWTLPVTSTGLLDGTAEIRGGKRAMGKAGRKCRPVKIRGQSPDRYSFHDLPGGGGNSLPPPAEDADYLDIPNIPAEPQPMSNVPSLPAASSLGPDGPGLPLPTGEGTETILPSETGPSPDPGVLNDSVPPSDGLLPAPMPVESVAPPLNSPGTSATGPNSVEVDFDATQPLMSYTRMFDGAEAELVNKLRDYLELRGDRRSGSWEEYLHRSEDFIRFVSHVMIVEMLSVHGGANRTQIVFKLRKYR